ncbi:MAG: AsmA-like C-terminal region-containing protein, partial [Pseudomonadota bacterium]
LVISDALSLTNLTANLPGANGGTGRFEALVNGKAPFTADLARQRAGIAAELRSENAGALLAAANFFSNARGGRLDLRMVPLGPAGHYEGQLTVTGGSLHGAGTAAEILSALSVVGAIDQMSGAGIVFTEIGASFSLTPDRLTLKSAYAEGPSLGLSLDGTVALDTQRLDLQGAVSPVHFINQVGGPRRGEGLLGVSFRVSGTTRTPEVEVIPLSLLTPGFLREMFRKPTAPGN